MSQSRLLAVIVGAIVAASAILFSANAVASETRSFCSSVFLQSDETCVDPNYHTYLVQVSGASTGSASVCVGGADPAYSAYTQCSAPGQSVSTGFLGFADHAALHNHSTFQSRFNGTVTYGT